MTLTDVEGHFSFLKQVQRCNLRDMETWSFHFLTNVNSRSHSLYAVARPSVVCNVRAPYSAGWNFRQCFYGIWRTLAIRWHPRKNLRRSSQGNHAAGGFKRKRVTNIAILDLSKAISRKRNKIEGKLVLTTNRKSYELSTGTKIGDLEWPWTA